MADNFRQDASSKIHNAVVPDAEKTWTEQKKDQITGNADKLASQVQPHHDKSTSQKVVDAVTPGNSSHIGEDHVRRSPGDTLKAAVVPDSQKREHEVVKDKVVGKTDNALGEAQPAEHKGIVQKVKDAILPHSGNHSHSTAGTSHTHTH